MRGKAVILAICAALWAEHAGADSVVQTPAVNRAERLIAFEMLLRKLVRCKGPSYNFV